METEYRQQINSRSSERRDIENVPLPSQVSSQTQWNRTVAGEAETREDGLMWRFQSQKWLQFKGRRPVFCSWIMPNFCCVTFTHSVSSAQGNTPLALISAKSCQRPVIQSQMLKSQHPYEKPPYPQPSPNPEPSLQSSACSE